MGKARTPRKRWPVTFNDELVRYVASQLPELNRRQVGAVIQLTAWAILQSLEDQAKAGAKEPSVTIRRFGRFKLRWLAPRRLHHYKDGWRMTAGRWRLQFHLMWDQENRVRGWTGTTFERSGFDKDAGVATLQVTTPPVTKLRAPALDPDEG